MYRLPVLALTGVLVLAACEQSAPPTDPGGLPFRPALDIADGSLGGNVHFYFLPPLVPAPAFTGTFDPTLDPTVTICEWTGSACAAIVATFTTTSGSGSEVVRVDGGEEHYIVNWHTGAFALDPAKTYRIGVTLQGVELGHADVDVGSSGRELRGVDGSRYVGVVNGRTLPIKFRIEQGAVSCDALVAIDANNVVLKLAAGELPQASGVAGNAFFKGVQFLFAGGFAYGDGPSSFALGYNTRLGTTDYVRGPVCRVETAWGQQAFATLQPQSGVVVPPGLVVVQNAYAFAAAPDDDYVLLRYTVTNTGGAPVSGMVAGYTLDFDLLVDPAISNGFANDMASFDATIPAGTVIDQDSLAFPTVVGVVPVASIPLSSYKGWAPPDPLSKTGFWTFLISGIQAPLRVGPLDIREAVGFGPLTLAAGQSRSFVFAIVGGDDRADFAANAAAAQAKATALGLY